LIVYSFDSQFRTLNWYPAPAGFHFLCHTFLIIRVVDCFRFSRLSLLNVILLFWRLCVCAYSPAFFLQLSLSLCVNYQFKCKLWTDEDGCDTGEQKDGKRVLSYFPIVHCSLLPQRTYQEPFSRSLHKLFEKSWSVILWLNQSLN